MSNEKELREAYEEIKKLVDSATKKIKKAQTLANEKGISFCYDFGYGLHGIYKGYVVPDAEKIVDTTDWVGSRECPYYDDGPKNGNESDDIPF